MGSRTSSPEKTGPPDARSGRPTGEKIGKDQFVSIVRQYGHTKEEANALVDQLLNQIEAALLQGQSVNFTNIGTLSVKAVQPRIIRLPNAEFSAPPGRKVAFKISSALKKQL